MNRRMIFAVSSIGLAAVLGLRIGSAGAAEPEVFTGLVPGVAAGGWDAVSYFGKDGPMPGSADITTEWKGATWRFATPANRDAFIADPEKFAPQFGGYCAYAVSKGYTAKGEPEAWSVVGGKLYLNYSLEVRDLWSKDIPGHIAMGNANWPAVLAK